MIMWEMVYDIVIFKKTATLLHFFVVKYWK